MSSIRSHETDYDVLTYVNLRGGGLIAVSNAIYEIKGKRVLFCGAVFVENLQAGLLLQKWFELFVALAKFAFQHLHHRQPIVCWDPAGG